MKLLDGVTTNSSGEAVTFTPDLYNGYGKGCVYAYGTFDTCTITLEFTPDSGTTWVAVGTDTTFTSAGYSNFEINGTTQIRGTVSSVGASTDVSLILL